LQAKLHLTIEATINNPGKSLETTVVCIFLSGLELLWILRSKRSGTTGNFYALCIMHYIRRYFSKLSFLN